MEIHYDNVKDKFEVSQCEETAAINLDGNPLLITRPNMPLVTDTNYTYYIVEEYQSRWNRWCSLKDGWTYHLPNHMDDHEMRASGACWQATSHFGTFNKDYAVALCKDLKNMLIDIKVYGQYPSDIVKEHISTCEITDFRVCECHEIFRKNVIV